MGLGCPPNALTAFKRPSVSPFAYHRQAGVPRSDG
jgi:hypothetical protein